MPDLDARFEQARIDSKSLPEKPDTATLLQLYALYKQGSTGDAVGERPPFSAMVERAKWDAWAALKGQPPEQARQGYIDLVESLRD